LFAEADPSNAVAEMREDNNISAPVQFTVGPPTPNLVTTKVSGPAELVGGTAYAVATEVTNKGNKDTPQTAKISYFVSDNSVVSISDVLVDTDVVPVIAAGQIQSLSKNLNLPSDLPAGKYWIGACVDYDGAATPRTSITEISEVDNCLTGNSFIL